MKIKMKIKIKYKVFYMKPVELPVMIFKPAASRPAAKLIPAFSALKVALQI